MVLNLKARKPVHGASARTVPVEEMQKLKQWYAEMLKRKDREIDELKRTNEILMKSAFKRSEETEQLRTGLAELRERLKEKNKNSN